MITHHKNHARNTPITIIVKDIRKSYATNVCVLNRPYGIKRMHDLGYRTILVRDCTAALEYHDTLEEKWVTRMAVREVEKKEAGYSCTSRDFIEGFTE